jgi:hypothetical protein
MWDLAGIDGNRNRNTKFVFGHASRKEYESSIKGIPAIPQDTADLLIGFAAYPSGHGEPLLALHDLDIQDKHHVIVPVLERCRVSGLRLQRRHMDTREVIETTLPDKDVGIAMENVPYHPGGNARGLAHLGLVTTRNPNADSLQLDGIKVVPSIFFRDVQPFPGEPILATLVKLSDLVRQAIGRFRWVVVRRQISIARGQQ